MKKKYILSFDVTKEHERPIIDLTANGFHPIFTCDIITGLPVTCHQPNTTWWTEAEDITIAYYCFKSIVGERNLTRASIYPIGNWIKTIEKSSIECPFGKSNTVLKDVA